MKAKNLMTVAGTIAFAMLVAVPSLADYGDSADRVEMERVRRGDYRVTPRAPTSFRPAAPTRVSRPKAPAASPASAPAPVQKAAAPTASAPPKKSGGGSTISGLPGETPASGSKQPTGQAAPTAPKPVADSKPSGAKAKLPEQPKADANPAGGSTPAAGCAQQEAEKKKIVAAFDDAIKQLQAQVDGVTKAVDSTTRQVEAVRSRSACYGMVAIVNVSEKVNSGLQPVSPMLKGMAQQALDGSTEGKVVPGGVKAVIQELVATRTKLAALDVCKVTLCEGAGKVLSTATGPLNTQLANAKANLNQVAEMVKLGDQLLQQQIPELESQTLKTPACMQLGVHGNIRNALAGWKSFQQKFKGIRTEMTKRAQVVGAQALAMKQSNPTCSTLSASNK